MKKYLISGVGPGHSGVGRLMLNLIEEAQKNGYVCIHNHNGRSLKNLFIEKNPLFIIELLQRLFLNSIFFTRLLFIKNSEVILIHPQTIGYKSFFKLIKNNKVIKNYIMDNSFFCIQSYNTLNHKECLECIANLENCQSECKTFPINYVKSKNINYLKLYQKYSKKIIFYTQNKNQEKLLRLHFGNLIQTKVIGMKTGESFNKDFIRSEPKYDIVFHGGNYQAKGIEFIYEIAKYLNEYSILIPNNIDKKIEQTLPNNIIVSPMNWESGLKECVINAKLVLNPSIWSAPIESALLKSMFYNNNVAVIDTKYGFSSEFPNTYITKLPYDHQEAANIIKEAIDNPKNCENHINSILQTNNTHLLFEA